LPATTVPITSLKITPPGDLQLESGSLGELRAESLGIIWQVAEAGPPGVYSVETAKETLFATATAIPPEEADLMPLGSDVLTNRLAGGRDVEFRSAQDDGDERDSLWSALAVACLVCMLVELVSLRYFRC